MGRKQLLVWFLASLMTATVITVGYRFFGETILLGTITPDTPPLVVYSTFPKNDLVQYIAAFRSKHPEIKIVYETMTTGKLVERVQAESVNPQVDVIWGLSATVLQQLDWYDMLQPYAPEKLHHVEETMRDEDDPPAWVGHSVWMNAFCVNSKLLLRKEIPLPKSWSDLLDPIYDDLIGFPAVDSSSTGYMTLLAFESIYTEDKMWDALDSLDQNVKQYYTTSEEVCDAVSAEEVAIGVSYGLEATRTRVANGDIVVVFPEDKSGWDVEASALIRKATLHPHATALLDHIISDEAMHYYGQDYAITSVQVSYLRPPRGFPTEPNEWLLEKDFLWAGANRNRLIRVWSDRYARPIVSQE